MGFTASIFVACASIIVAASPLKAADDGGVRETLVNGDTNCDGELDISDAVWLLGHLFLGGDPPCPLADRPELLQRVADLQTEVKNLEAAIAAANEQIAAKDTEVMSLRSEVEQLRADAGSCQAELVTTMNRIRELEVRGCTDPEADNYAVKANVDDGSCRFSGCTDPSAFNYDSWANVDNGSCRYDRDAPGRLHLYRIVALPPLTVHVPEGEAQRINNAGQVIGSSLYGVLWQADGRVIALLSLTGSFVNVYPLALNDLGVVVGSAYDGQKHNPLRWQDDGSVAALPGGGGRALSINNSGVAVGTLNPTGDAVRWEPNGTVTFLEKYPESTQDTPVEINNRGQVAGGVELRTLRLPAVWDSEGKIRTLPTPFPFTGGLAADLNDDGLVVGYLNFPDRPGVAVLWDTLNNDRVLDLVPEPGGGNGTYALRVNNLGQVLVAGGAKNQYVYGDGLIVPLEDLIEELNGWIDLSARDINDNGVIVGTGTFDKVRRAFLMTPTEMFYNPN